MAKSIVLELQELAADGKASVTELLRKALIVATKLRIDDFREWIEKELNGYHGEDRPVPKYRELRGKPMVAQIYTGHRQAFLIDSDELRDTLTLIPTRESVAEIEALLSKADRTLHVDLPDKFQQMMNESNGRGVHVGHYYLEVSASAMAGVLNQVRDVVLKWALKLDEQGILGDGMTFSDSDKEKAANSPSVHIEHFTGQMRVNAASTDNSTNNININTSTVFNQLRDEIRRIEDGPAKAQALEHLDAIEKSKSQKTAMEKAALLMSLTANSIAVGKAVLPYWPLIVAFIQSQAQ